MLHAGAARCRTLLLLAALCAAGQCVALAAEVPLAQVAAIEVYPTSVSLRGKDDRQQMLVTARMRSGALSDVSRQAQYRAADPRVVSIDSAGVAHPAASGKTTIEIRVGSQRARIAVEVQQGEAFRQLDFTRDITPILTKAGCNGGGCHGKSDGRGGFQLSLFGFDPAGDYEAIVKKSRGRRLSLASPASSLLLCKPSGSVPHGGGKRLTAGEPEFECLQRWIAQGAPWGDTRTPELASLEVQPAQRSLGNDQQQQLSVTAVYSDGSRREVTRTTELRSNDTSVAEVDEHGLVTTRDRTGETAIVCIYQGQVAVSRMTVPLAAPKSKWQAFPIANVIDQHVEDKLREIGVAPSPLVDDASFLRRASLQITGRLPTVADVRAFLADTSLQKRAQLVDRLLASDGYADHFAQKWSDVLRNKRRGQAERLSGTIAFHRWIRNAIAEDMPYDEFVRSIITASGSQATYPPAQWYAEVRYLDRYVDDTAQVFLGVRIGCARCHHHPFENFSQDDYYGLAAFFARVGRKGGIGVDERRANETVYVKADGDVKHPMTGKVVPPHGLGGPPLDVPAYGDPREKLVDWMVEPKNPYFARAFVNRMWAHFFSRGLIEPLDDIRVTNPASNEPLLDDLAEEFVASGFNMRHIVKLICTSSTYQLSSLANADNLDETQSHSRFYPQRMSAEVLLDAIDTATGNATSYGGMPSGTRAVQLPDEDSGNAFLNLFGRPPRESACECERQAKPNLSQSLFLMNDSFFIGKVYNSASLASRLGASSDKRPPAKKVEELFLAVLSRPPRPEETERALKYVASESSQNTAYRDLMWALLNTKEFLYIH